MSARPRGHDKGERSATFRIHLGTARAARFKIWSGSKMPGGRKVSVKSYAESYEVLCGGKVEPVTPLVRLGGLPNPSVNCQSLSRGLSTGLSTTKTEMRTQGLSTTKAMYQDFAKTCTKTFTCIMSW